jgi:hypothetical protein
MKKKLLFMSLSLAAVLLFTFLGYKMGYSKGYDEAAQRGYDYAECVGTADHSIAVSDPPQCLDDDGTHPGP